MDARTPEAKRSPDKRDPWKFKKWWIDSLIASGKVWEEKGRPFGEQDRKVLDKYTFGILKPLAGHYGIFAPDDKDEEDSEEEGEDESESALLAELGIPPGTFLPTPNKAPATPNGEKSKVGAKAPVYSANVLAGGSGELPIPFVLTPLPAQKKTVSVIPATTQVSHAENLTIKVGKLRIIYESVDFEHA